MTIEAVIFDFDGLLMDTESSMVESWQYEYAQHGLTLDLDTFSVNHGGDVTDQRYAVLAELVGAGYDRETSHARRLAYRNGLQAALGLSAGIADWLRECRDLGLRLAVASSSPRHWVRNLLTGVDSFDVFELIASGDEVAKPKPDPAVYELALQRLDLTAQQAVAVEDSPHGVAAAKAAGMQCVAIPNHHTDKTRFGAADIVLDSAADVSLGQVLDTLAGHRRD